LNQAEQGKVKPMGETIKSIRRKIALEEALEDVASGRITTIHIPKNQKKENISVV